MQIVEIEIPDIWLMKMIPSIVKNAIIVPGNQTEKMTLLSARIAIAFVTERRIRAGRAILKDGIKVAKKSLRK